jgi:outer membrane protein TolC
VITLPQCLDAALSTGIDSKILQGGLQISRAQTSAVAAANALGLDGSLAYNASGALGDPGMLGVRSGASGSTGSAAAGPQAGLVLSGPSTSLGLSLSPYVAPTSSTAAASALGLNLSQTLWDGYPGGQASAAVKKSILSLQGKELAAQSTSTAILARIKQAYYTMLGSQRSLAVKGQIVEQQDSLLKQMSAIYDLQQASAVDLKTAQINAKSAHIDVESAQHDLRISRLRLANLLGWPRDKDFTVAEAEDPAVPVASVEEAVSMSLGRRTELKQLALYRQSSAIDLDLFRGQKWPIVSVNGGVSWTFDWLGDNGGTAAVGVKVALPVYDAGYLDLQIGALRLQQSVYDLQEAQLRDSISTDVEEAYELVQIQMERLEVAKLSVEKFDIQFTLMKTRLDKGTATNQDVMSASIDLANAQSALSKAQRDAQLAVLQLQTSMGY